MGGIGKQRMRFNAATRRQTKRLHLHNHDLTPTQERSQVSGEMGAAA